MNVAAHISYRNSCPVMKIIFMRVWRYLQTAYLLHFITLISIYLCFYCSKEVIVIIRSSNRWQDLILFIFLSVYTFTIPFFSQLDAYSRYQNYKMIKDKIYQYGFDRRLLHPFILSRCQRDAISVAVHELNYSEEWRELIGKWRFMWYHILPRIIIKKPTILLTKQYWIKTLFVKSYRLKYFLW